MGEIDVLAELSRDNPQTSLVNLRIYSDALLNYCLAAQNVKENGSICAHPRTGAPIENPYLRIMNDQGKILRGMQMVKGDRILKMLLGQKTGSKNA